MILCGNVQKHVITGIDTSYWDSEISKVQSITDEEFSWSDYLDRITESANSIIVDSADALSFTSAANTTVNSASTVSNSYTLTTSGNTSNSYLTWMGGTTSTALGTWINSSDYTFTSLSSYPTLSNLMITYLPEDLIFNVLTTIEEKLEDMRLIDEDKYSEEKSGFDLVVKSIMTSSRVFSEDFVIHFSSYCDRSEILKKYASQIVSGEYEALKLKLACEDK